MKNKLSKSELREERIKLFNKKYYLIHEIEALNQMFGSDFTIKSDTGKKLNESFKTQLAKKETELRTTSAKLEIIDDELKRRFPALETKKEDDVLNCGGLKLNIPENTLSYKGNKPIEAGIHKREIRFLKLLMQNKNKIVGYGEIFQTLIPIKHNKIRKELKEAGQENIEKIIDKYYMDNIYRIKGDLIKTLSRTGLDKSKAEKMIRTIKGFGYQLNCEES